MTDIKTDNGLLSTTVAYWPIFFYRNTEIIINSNNYGMMPNWQKFRCGIIFDTSTAHYIIKIWETTICLH